jgi:hypothetical protein
MGLKYWMLDPASCHMHPLETGLSSRVSYQCKCGCQAMQSCLQVNFTQYLGGREYQRVVVAIDRDWCLKRESP